MEVAILQPTSVEPVPEKWAEEEEDGRRGSVYGEKAEVGGVVPVSPSFSEAHEVYGVLWLWVEVGMEDWEEIVELFAVTVVVETMGVVETTQDEGFDGDRVESEHCFQGMETETERRR